MYTMVVVIGGFVFEWDLNMISQVINDLKRLVYFSLLLTFRECGSIAKLVHLVLINSPVFRHVHRQISTFSRFDVTDY